LLNVAQALALPAAARHRRSATARLWNRTVIASRRFFRKTNSLHPDPNRPPSLGVLSAAGVVGRVGHGRAGCGAMSADRLDDGRNGGNIARGARGRSERHQAST